ncbi:MAG: GNAT family protein [Chthoniobacteraceae bacterium]
MSAGTFPAGGWPMPVAKVFAGRFVTLTPLNLEADADDLFRGSHEPDSVDAMWRLIAAGPFADAAAMREWLRAQQALPDLIPFTVNDNATGRRIGSISIMRITPAHGVAELGFIWYEPAAQRTKANTEANYLLLRHCFADLGYRRMEWKCNAENARSRAAALRLGYSFEGIFRQHMVIKGRNRDTAWFAMLDHAWPRIAAAMEHWLYTDDSLPLAASPTDAP